MMGNQQNMLHHVVSLLFGASVAVVLLFFFSSAGHSTLPTAGISSWARGSTAIPPAVEANRTSKAVAHAEENANQTTAVPEQQQDLEQLLRAVADEDRTIIMTSVNEAWAAEGSLLDLFLESFRAGERIAHFAEHLLIVALDGKAFERCRAVHPHCYLLEVAGNLSAEKVFMSKDYLDLVWSKVRLQQRILELGYNFLFTDVDILWFRNPFERMSVAAHMVTSSDFYFGEPFSPANFPNTGFLYVKAGARTVGAFEAWRGAREAFPGKHEQQVLNEIKFELVARRGLRIQFLDTAHNAGFCNNTRDFNTLYTMHANCCVGLGAKLHDLGGLLTEWRAYREMDEGERRRGPVRWKVPGICIH